MPSTTSPVGALTLPVPVGAANSKLSDPFVDGLLDYLAFFIKNSLDAKLATLIGTPADAVPTTNRFTYDPDEPQGQFVKLPTPALFVWWTGESEVRSLSMHFDFLIRQIHALYVFEELPREVEMAKRAGLLHAVNATFAKAAERQRHPSYGYNSFPVGTPLFGSLGVDPDTVAFRYLGGKPERFGIDNDKRGRRDQAGRTYPAIRGRFEVHERVEQDTMEVGDALGDVELTINATGGEAPPAEHMVRYLPAPDGSEEL